MKRVGCLVVGMLLVAGCAAPAEKPPAGVVQAAPLERAIVILQMDARSSDAATHANAIEALQPSSDPRAAEVIEQGLHDPAWVVRFAAAMATGKRRTFASKPRLVEMAGHDENDSVRVAAIYALYRIGDRRFMNTLATTLSSSDPAVRANTALVLGLMGDSSATNLLQAHAKEEDPRVKFEITAALARLGDARAQNVIASLAVSKFAEDQWNAMMVCPDLPSDLAANALVLGLQNSAPSNTPEAVEDLTVRRQLVAARSLGKMHSAQGAKVAIDHLKDPNPGLRALAALALGEMLAPQQDEGLAPLLSDPDASVRLAAAAAIVNIWSRGTAAAH